MVQLSRPLLIALLILTEVTRSAWARTPQVSVSESWPGWSQESA